MPLTLNKLQWPRTGNTGTLLPGLLRSHTRAKSRGKAQNPRSRPTLLVSCYHEYYHGRRKYHEWSLPMTVLHLLFYISNDFPPVAGKVITPTRCESSYAPCPIVFRWVRLSFPSRRSSFSFMPGPRYRIVDYACTRRHASRLD